MCNKKMYNKNWYIKNKEKSNAACKAYYEANKESIHKKAIEYSREYRADPLTFFTRCVPHYKRQAKLKGCEFNLTKEYLESIFPLNNLCPILKIKMSKSMQRHNLFYSSASLDRIDNLKGYIKGNVHFISRKANTMKSDASITELKLFSSWISKL
tara:strand:- start:45 stop:509 length:465 start_codon:yes stop_codon:yes gene_type:complete